MNEQAVSIWNLINTGGVVATLTVIVIMFFRGDILPRKVYTELTTKILNELCGRIIEGVRDMLREELRRGKDEEGR